MGGKVEVEMHDPGKDPIVLKADELPAKAKENVRGRRFFVTCVVCGRQFRIPNLVAQRGENAVIPHIQHFGWVARVSEDTDNAEGMDWYCPTHNKKG